MTPTEDDTISPDSSETPMRPEGESSGSTSSPPENLGEEVPEPVALASGEEVVEPAEAAEIGAVDNEVFCRYFFPETFRDPFESFHHQLWNSIENPEHRYVSAEIFRGGSKTTILRGVLAKRVSYAISRTIVVLSRSQTHAIRTLLWLQNKFQRNHMWRDTFGLQKGHKWSQDEMQILHGVEGVNITILAVGVEGQTRGINVDDYRPDLIIVDDPCDEENTGTPEQREKLENEFFGSIAKSLAPPKDSESATMALLQTPLAKGDLVDRCRESPHWHHIRIPCFTEDSEGNEVSVWEDRFPTRWLKDEKEEHVRLGKLPLWLREMECKIVSEETADFPSQMLQYWDESTLPEWGFTAFGIDPASSEEKEADEQAQVYIRVYNGCVYVLEYALAKGQMPDEFATDFFHLTTKWRAFHGTVESISYQRVLAWFLRREMARKYQYRVVHEIKADKRKKRDRIIQVLRPLVANGALYVHPSHVRLIQDIESCPDLQRWDLLDALARAVEYALNSGGDVLEGEWDVLDESEYKDQEEHGLIVRSAP